MIMSIEKIALCITNYKKEKFLDRAIRSCDSQILNGFEIITIIVNDGSPNFDKKKISKEFPEVKIIDYKKNKGVAHASNKALFDIKSDYFMRVDADDYIGINTCLILTSVLNNNKKIPYVYGDILQIDKKFSVNRISRNKRNLLLEYGSGVMFRTKFLKSIGGYDNKIKNCEDFDIIIRVEKKFGKGFYIPLPYYKYYVQSNRHLSKSKNRQYYLNKLKKKYSNYLNI
jgi:glycosyltransferase involved in cell wall biosynthesis